VEYEVTKKVGLWMEPCDTAGMKKTKTNKPTVSKFSVLRQICNLIPEHKVPSLARELGVEDQSRTFSPWSHVVSLLYAQLTHSLGLNDVCDGLALHSGPLSAIRGATPASKNGLSHANRSRDPRLAEHLFYGTLEHLRGLEPGFGRGRYPRFAFRFKRPIEIVDSTTIKLMAQCLDWAKHRRRKAAAKCHLRLNLQSFLPSFALVESAGEHDSQRARELCAGLKAGEIVVFDKAYLDLDHLRDLSQRGVHWVTRARDDLKVRVVKRLQPPEATGPVLRDDLVKFIHPNSNRDYPEVFRRVIAMVEVDGELREMVFLTNQLSWSAQSVTDLYRCRWSIEVFFKELKQTLQLADFLGHNANAVRWQVWTALLVQELLRFCAFVSRWGHSFTRLFTLLRSALWQKLDLQGLLQCCGTAKGRFHFLAQPQQAYLPGFS
jgi:hypothetical protein